MSGLALSCRWHLVVVMLAATGILLASCGHSSPAIPSASSKMEASTRLYLRAAGSSLFATDRIAGSLNVASSDAQCAADADSLVSLNPKAASSGGIADPELAQLVADEYSALGRVLSQCEAGHPSSTAISSLDSIHAAVISRLNQDGVHQ